ncbi:MAG: hypothetical protein AAF703_10165 [Cyanobacteria bacterium P01_D01_bin.105]
MAIVLALVILGWLVAFALAAQAGFQDEPSVTATATSASVAEPAQPQAQAAYRDPVSAA